MSLHFTKIVLNYDIKVSHQDLAQHMPASPDIVGEELAHQVHRYASTHSMGYYPALDFFIDSKAVDTDLLNAAENIAWVAAQIVRHEIRTKLRPIFSNVSIDSLQTLAFTLPRIRMRQRNAQLLLAQHYTPSEFKVNIITTMIQKQKCCDTAQQLAKSMSYQWLKNSFPQLKVTGTRVI